MHKKSYTGQYSNSFPYPVLLPHLKFSLIGAILIFLLFPAKINAQKLKLDSILSVHDTIGAKYYVHLPDSMQTGKIRTFPTTKLDQFQRYEPTIEGDKYYATLGNIGLAHNNLIFKPHIDPGFHFGIRSWDEYLYNYKNIKYFIHEGPLTSLKYVNGPNKENDFRALYSQHLGDMVTIMAGVNVINSPGSYVRQAVDNRTAILGARFETKDKRYGAIATYFWNKFLWQENGGIANDSVFEENRESNRRIIDVNLQTAENRIKESGVIVNQYFFLTKAKPDSILKRNRTFHLGRIGYTFSLTRQQQLYTDSEPLNPFYSTFDTITDTTATYDSVFIRRFENTFTWSNLSVNDDPLIKPIYVSFSLRHQYADVGGYLDKQIFTSLIPMGELILRPLKSSLIEVNGHYSIGDFNNNGFYVGGFWRQQIIKEENPVFYFKASAFLTSQEKGFFYSKYSSNYLSWANDFKHEKYTNLGFALGRKEFEAQAQYYLVNDFIFMNEGARPEQFTTPFSLLQIRLTHHLRIKKFSIDYDLVYQQASNNDILRLPKFMGRATFMFTLPVFGNASVLQPGLDFYYNTAYYADDYLPSIRSFFIQNENKIGNYLYADIFLNLMLKRFKIFAKFQHLNGFFGNYTYYMVPHYPMQDAAFKFGLSWNFYD